MYDNVSLHIITLNFLKQLKSKKKKSNNNEKLDLEASDKDSMENLDD
jgi:hypothetical protein